MVSNFLRGLSYRFRVLHDTSTNINVKGQKFQKSGLFSVVILSCCLLTAVKSDKNSGKEVLKVC